MDFSLLYFFPFSRSEGYEGYAKKKKKQKKKKRRKRFGHKQLLLLSVRIRPGAPKEGLGVEKEEGWKEGKEEAVAVYLSSRRSVFAMKGEKKGNC